jgi:DNA adenine methylase
MKFEEAKIKPVLRWAGGKSWLFEKIEDYVPTQFNNYYEPFVGGASLFLNLQISKYSYISDVNSELICFYKQVKSNLPKLEKKIKQYKNSASEFYRVRDSIPRSELGTAARFYFLNRTCFNGLYRVNNSGKFNVPYAFRDVEIYDSKSFNNLNKKLQNADISCCDFEKALEKAKKGDFVFLDPPYTVAHNRNGFIEYNQKIFSWEDQERLNKSVKMLIEKEVFFIMSNAWHPSLKKLYKGVGKHIEIERYSTIGGQMNSRIQISELIITNCISKNGR